MTRFLMAGLVATVAMTATPVAAQDEDADTARTVPEETAAVTRHAVRVDGQTIRYTATVGNLLLHDDDGDPTASVFYIAYTKDDAGPARRPVTFLYNGGPGSASIWLHMGSFAPVRVVTENAGAGSPAPYTLVPNAQSLIDRTDLVFIDAVGTGYSRIVGEGEADDFFGVDQDVRAFADFIGRWVTENRRWNSPKFLLGESYGTTRSAGLAALLDRRGMPMNGVVLVSSWLDGYVDFGNPPFALDLPYILYLPTMAATAWYHEKLPGERGGLEPFLDEVRSFAIGDYAHALALGARLSDAARDSIAQTLHRYTGLAVDFIREADLRITPGRFEKELLRGERRTVGRLDSRYLGIDHDAAGESPEYDASDAAINGAFTTAFNDYLRTELEYEADAARRYRTSGDVGEWDWHHRTLGGRYPMFDVSEDLRQAMTRNPRLQVFSANGYFDFATPFFETEYTLDHMGLDPSLRGNIHYGYYRSGHMIYLNPDALAAMKKDLGAFYDAVLARPTPPGGD